MLSMVCTILIVLYVSSDSRTLLHKKQCDISSIGAGSIKFSQPKLSAWDDLWEVRKSKYEKDIIMSDVENKKDCAVILVCWI